MANRKFKSQWMLFALVPLSLTPLPVHPTSLLSHFSSLQYHSLLTPDSPHSKQHRPRGWRGGRHPGGMCVIAPGLLEGRNVIWSDHPLFVWSAPSEITMQRIELIDQTQRIVWEKSLAATEQTAGYEGQPLQPGQVYTWRLHWRVQNAQYSVDYTFQLMEADQRNQIIADLQSLTRQLPAPQLSTEAIASQQVNYLLNRSEPLWSDALQVLYSIENPSAQTTQQIQTWINTACSQEENR